MLGWTGVATLRLRQNGDEPFLNEPFLNALKRCADDEEENEKMRFERPF